MTMSPHEEAAEANRKAAEKDGQQTADDVEKRKTTPLKNIPGLQAET